MLTQRCTIDMSFSRKKRKFYMVTDNQHYHHYEIDYDRAIDYDDKSDDETY